MSDIDNGGPAFPTENEHQSGANTYHYEGMQLRDYFAAKAMPLVMAKLRENYTKDDGDSWHWTSEDFHFIAMDSYELADAMIKAGKS